MNALFVDTAAPARARATPRPGLVEQQFAFVALLMFVSMPFIVGGQPYGAEALNPVDSLETVSTAGDQLKQVILLGLYATFGGLLVVTSRRALMYLGAPLLLLLCWTFASAAWSVNPEVTIRRAVALLGTVAMGLHFGLRFDMRRLIVILCSAGLILLAASLALALVSPTQGLDFEGRLRGVTAHKNDLGSFAAIVAVAAMGLASSGSGARLSRAPAIALLVLAAICMAWARSASVLPVLAVAFLALVCAGRLRRAGPGAIACLPLIVSFAVLATLVLFTDAGALSEWLGKDPNMSGRTLVWAFAAKMIALRPVAGYGLGAFWVGADSPGAVFWFTSHIGVPHAHNGFIQLALELGGVGVALFAAALLVLGARLLWLLVVVDQKLIPWMTSFVVFYLVANVSESWLWVGNELLTVIFVSILVRTNVLYRTALVSRTGTTALVAGRF